MGGALLSPLRRPVGTLATLLVVWLASLAVLLPVSWALGVIWDAVREAYLSPVGTGYAGAVATLAIVTLALCATWVGAVLLGGFVSALRAALWSAEGLR